MTQAVWSTAHGDLLSVTDVHGEQISRLGAHFDPILALLAPLWWLWPTRSCCSSSRRSRSRSGALPVFWLARKHLGVGVAGGRARARLPALPAGAVADRERLPPGRARVPAAPLRVLVPRRGPAVGVRALRRGRDRDEGARRARGRGDGRLVRGPPPRRPDRARRSRLAAGVAALRRSARRRPALRARRRLGFESRYDVAVARRARPLATSPRSCCRSRCSRSRAPLALLAALPELALNLLSTTVTQTSVQDALRGGGDPGAPRRDRLRRRAARRAASPTSSRVGARSPGRVVLGPLGRLDASRRRARRRRAPRRWRSCPAGAPVSATNTLGAHLSERRRIFSFPVLERGGVGRRRRAAADVPRQPGPGRARPHLAALHRDPRWRLVFAEDGVLVFRRR